MTRPYTYRPRSQWKLLHARIVKLAKREPELVPAAIAERLECSHVTVRKALRAANLYKPRGPGGFEKKMIDTGDSEDFDGGGF